MEFKKILNNKKQFLNLLLLADEKESMIVGTGYSPLTIPFYERLGFKISHRVKNFFIDNYDHPIFEEGIQLIDMVYLKMNL